MVLRGVFLLGSVKREFVSRHFFKFLLLITILFEIALRLERYQYVYIKTMPMTRRIIQ